MIRFKPFYRIAIIVFSLILTWIPAQAGGAGGIDVSGVRVCVDGVTLTGQAVSPEVLNRFFRGAILRGHVGTGAPNYWGRTQIFTSANEALHFLLQYPDSTFILGESVTVSVLAQDSSGYGGGVFTRVQDCRIADLLETSNLPAAIASPINPTRVQFEVGTSAAIIQDTVSVNQTTDYVLGAMAGQRMTVNLISSSNQAYLAISGVDGQILLDPAYVQNTWTGTLPATQDYYVQVVSDAVAEDYSLEIIIPPAPNSDNYIQYQQSASNRIAFNTALKLTLSAHDYEGLAALMADPFNFAGWQMGGSSRSASEVIDLLRNDFLPETGTIEFPDNVDMAAIIPGINLFQLFPGADSFIYSRGWGIDGNGEVILIIRQDPETVFIWESLLIAPNGFAPTNVSATPVALAANCDFAWYFSRVPEECPASNPLVSDAVAQYFEGGLLIWVSQYDIIYVIFTDGLAPSWMPYADPWQVGMPDSSIVDTSPQGLLLPIRGFGLVWQESNNPERLGWATGEEFAFQTQIQCDERTRTFACYLEGPAGIIQLRGGSLWSDWDS